RWTQNPEGSARPKPNGPRFDGRRTRRVLLNRNPTGFGPGAGDGIRTRDIQLGKLTLYQLSYSRALHLGTPAALLIGERVGVPMGRRTRRGAWWAGLDSNQRRRKPTDLQSVPFNHSGTYPCPSPSGRSDLRSDLASDRRSDVSGSAWSHPSESNRQP